MKTAKIAISFAVMLLVAAPAQAWWARNSHEVLPVSDTVWEVVGEVGSAPGAYWCGMGDYAITQLGTPATQRIYIWEGFGPSVSRPGRNSVKFSLTPPEGAETRNGFFLSKRRAGRNLNAVFARDYCNDNAGYAVWQRP